MTEVDPEVLNNFAGRGHELIHKHKMLDFLDELQLKTTFKKAYIDPTDKLPVMVLEVVTSKVAQNSRGELHTGALCAIFDHLTTSAVFADPGWWDIEGTEASIKPEIIPRIHLELGLSRNIEVHIQRPVIAGSTVYMVNKVTENSPTCSYFSSQLFDEKGVLLATGHHDKVKLTKKVKAKL